MGNTYWKIVFFSQAMDESPVPRSFFSMVHGKQLTHGLTSVSVRPQDLRAHPKETDVVCAFSVFSARRPQICSRGFVLTFAQPGSLVSNPSRVHGGPRPKWTEMMEQNNMN